jgi:hypothetical protein
VKKHRIPDPTVIKIGMKNKITFFLLFIVSGQEQIKEQGFLRKSHQKTYPLDPGSEIRDQETFIPDPGG